jgi:hypothetical protein
MTIIVTQEQKDKLINDLKAHIMKIKFTKINGETREIVCTLNEIYLPKKINEPNIDKPPRKKSMDVISVWDLVKNDWRGIRWNNIVEFYKND